MFRASKVVEVQ